MAVPPDRSKKRIWAPIPLNCGYQVKDVLIPNKTCTFNVPNTRNKVTGSHTFYACRLSLMCVYVCTDICGNTNLVTSTHHLYFSRY